MRVCAMLGLGGFLRVYSMQTIVSPMRYSSLILLNGWLAVCGVLPQTTRLSAG